MEFVVKEMILLGFAKRIGGGRDCIAINIVRL